jgi:hypothetical protein
MTGRSAARLTAGVLLGVVAGACWPWGPSAAVLRAGPVLLPLLLGLVLLIPAGVLIWMSTERSTTG